MFSVFFFTLSRLNFLAVILLYFSHFLYYRIFSVILFNATLIWYFSSMVYLFVLFLFWNYIYTNYVIPVLEFLLLFLLEVSRFLFTIPRLKFLAVILLCFSRFLYYSIFSMILFVSIFNSTLVWFFSSFTSIHCLPCVI